MLETIRAWNPRTNIRVKYIDGRGNKNTWTCNQAELAQMIIQITDQYKAMDIKLSTRQTYYQLVAADAVYKRISKFITDGRYGGVFDWEVIEDRGRTSKRHSQWSGIPSLIESALDSYRLPRWSGQPYYVEMLCEKQAGESVLKPIADKWHVRFGYNKGYTSAAAMYDMSKRVMKALYNGQDVVILYLGDHDPSGLDMIRDIKERMVEFLTEGEDPQPIDIEYVREHFFVHPLALTKEQIEKYSPPPNPAKFSDPRSKDYVAIHGEVSWELDAIDPTTLQEITEDGILQYLDEEMYNAVLYQEDEDAKILIEFGKSLED